jgi:vacuolar-type H+-ATPase subunit H
MDRKEILNQLKTTEAEIRNKIEAAQHKKNEMITLAQKQAQKLEDDGEQRIKKEREKSLSAAKKEIEEKRQKTLQTAQADAEALKKKIQTKKAVEFFISKFKEYVHV